MSTSIPH